MTNADIDHLYWKILPFYLPKHIKILKLQSLSTKVQTSVIMHGERQLHC